MFAETRQRINHTLTRLIAAWERWHTPDWPLPWPIVLGLALLAFYLVSQVDIREDWHFTFYPAGQNWLDPYENSFHLVYPPWLALILAPFTLLPEDLARGGFAAFSVILTAYTIRQLGGGFITLVLVLLTPFYVTIMVRGMVDALALFGLGVAMAGGPSPFGQAAALLLLLLKPQMMLGAAAFLCLFTLKTAYQENRYTPVIQLGLGSGGWLLLSFLIYGWWPQEVWIRLPDLYQVDNISPWPWGIPIGLLLLGVAYHRHSLPWATLATGFFMPYLNWYSLGGYLVILFARSPRWVAAAVLVLSWIWFIQYTA